MPLSRIPAALTLETRDGTDTKDALIVNAYIEQLPSTKAISVTKRAGLVTSDTFTAGTGQGIYSYNSNLWAVIGGTLYSFPPGGTHTTVGSLVGGTGVPVSFSNTNNNAYLFLHNGTNGYTVTSGGTFASITSAGFPPNNGYSAGAICPGAASLDTYIFIMTTDAKIWMSNSNDPTTWNALNYISAEIDSDAGVAIARQLNYIVAFKQYNVEFFYDAVNQTGSVLSPNTSATIKSGCANGNSVVSLEGTIIWIAQGKETGKSVMLLDGITPGTISTPAVERILETDALTNVRAYAYRQGGHTFYILSLPDSNVTLVYDINMKTWYTWSSVVSSVEGYFNQTFGCSYNNKEYVLNATSGVVSYFSRTTYQDNGNPINVQGRTPLLDSDNNLKKFYRGCRYIGDRTTVTSNLSLRHTDDDYNTWSSYYTLDISTNNPTAWSLGSSRRRAFDWLYTDNYPFRIQALELEFSQGIN